jgi:hypothetical protein
MPLLKSACGGRQEWPAGCPHGEETLPNVDDPDTPGAYFDFSKGALVYGDEARREGDICLQRTFIAGNPALHVSLHDDMADSILYKPTAPNLNWTEQPDAETPARVSIYNGHCIWVRTGEGNIGKIKILLTESNENVTSFNWVKIEWIYQPNGSDTFLDQSGTTGTPQQ